jgi:hypothetical protein
MGRYFWVAGLVSRLIEQLPGVEPEKVGIETRTREMNDHLLTKTVYARLSI